MNEFVKRTLSAAVYAAVVVSSILVNRFYFGAVFLLVTLLAVREYMVLMKASKGMTVATMLTGGLLFVSGFFLTLAFVEVMGNRLDQFLFLGIGGACLCLCMVLGIPVAQVFAHSEHATHNRQLLWQALWEIAMPLTMTNLLLGMSPYCLLMVFITIWVNDTGAYIVGCTTAKLLPRGNHKMCPSISPAKSWEGLAGGFLFTLMAAWVFMRIGWLADAFLDGYVPSVNGWHVVVFALVIASAATLGDLMESQLKRSVGVKDSGCFMPGHGGVLDRFDSILFAVPVWCMVALLVSVVQSVL